MRRRICAMGAALGVCSLAFVASSATAAGTKSNAGKSPTQKVACTAKTSIMIPAGQSSVSPPAQQGSEFGKVNCAKLLGSGVQQDTFTVPASGDTVAKYWMYFRGGTLYGKYDLTPSGESSSFLETDWTGTLKVLGGTGAYKGITGVGTMVCKSMDGIHTNCTDKLKLKGA